MICMILATKMLITKHWDHIYEVDSRVCLCTDLSRVSAVEYKNGWEIWD